MLSKKKVSFEHYVSPLLRIFSTVNPNVLTVIGSIPSLLFFVCILMHWYGWALIAFVGNIFDLVDGMVARRFHKVTTFGGFLDSTLDRVSDCLIITAFAFSHLVRWEIVLPLLVFSYLTSYIRSRGELASEKKASFAIGIVERPERLLCIFLSLVFYMIFPAFIIFSFNIVELLFMLLGFLSFVTVCQRMMFAYKTLQ